MSGAIPEGISWDILIGFSGGISESIFEGILWIFGEMEWGISIGISGEISGWILEREKN